MSLSASTRPRIRAVVFDVGEVLVDESAEYGAWADWLGVPRHTFSAMFGATICLGEDYRKVFEYFQPGFDLDKERTRRAEAGRPETFSEQDLYADARPCLSALQHRGLFVGVAGNQTARAEDLLRGLALPVDMITTSSSLGAEKPSLQFFQRLAHATGYDPSQIAYVGDRLDNDIRPALSAGMRAVFLRRGPWGYQRAEDPDAQRAHARIPSLKELPQALETL
jgi:FMN phosphatase YigB (HAD superfamily)